VSARRMDATESLILCCGDNYANCDDNE
jgi:hypothetical protein